MDLEFYPLDHGDPKNVGWVVFTNTDGWLDIRCWDETKGWVILQLPRQYGWLPISYWRPAETCPDKAWTTRVGNIVYHGKITNCDGWQPMPIAPPPKQAPENPLAKISDADLIAEIKRRMGAK